MTANDATLKQARELIRQGRLDQARQLLERTLSTGNRSLEAAELLGQIGIRTHQADLAARAYALALSIEPGVARNKLNFAIALNALGRGREAEVPAREFLAAEPRSLPGLFTLATAVRLQGRFDEALQLARKGVDAHADRPETWLSLAEIEELSGDHRAAAGTLAKAAERFPRDRNVLTQHARLAYVIGDRTACEAACRTLLEDDPDDGAAHWQLTMVRRCSGPEDSDLAAARATAERPGVDDEQVMEAHYALARMYDQIGEFDKAMSHAREANQRHHRRHPFDMAGLVHTVDRLLASPASDSPGAPAPGPLFIVGMPRSGTTLLEQMLASHPDIDTGGESGWMQRWAPVHRGEARGPSPEAYRRLYLKSLGHRDGLQYSIDKMPTNFLCLDAIAGLFPQAPVIHIRRNALDICRSCYFSNFRTGNFWTNDIDDLESFHAQYRRLMAHWRAHPPLPLHEVDYEDLVRDPRPVIAGVLDFLGLPWDDACLHHESRKAPVTTVSSHQVRQPVHQNAVGRSAPYARYFPGLDAD